MSTDVKAAATSGALAGLATLKTGLQNVQQSISNTGGGMPILRLIAGGTWLYGADNVEVQEGSLWAMNPLSLQHGFICWKQIPKDSKEKPELLGEELRPMFQPLPNKDLLPSYGHPWAEIVAIGLKCLNGDDAGLEVVYKPSSMGGLREMKTMIATILEHIDRDPEHPAPVVSLESDFYDNTKYGGRTYFPVLKIVKWVGMDGVAAPAAPEAPPAAEAKPAGRSRRAPVQDSPKEPAPASEAPTGSAEAPAQTTAGTQEAAAPPASGGERRRRRPAVA